MFCGDADFLSGLVEDSKTQQVAFHGLLAGLGVGASNRSDPFPLDYRQEEKLLAMTSSKIKRLVKSELEPGSSFIEIKPSDVDEAVRGLESKHAIIRQHAVCVLGDRGLGKAVAKRVLPLLAERLHDKVPNVQRLTLLALSYWKAAANPYHQEMKSLQKDKNADVRFWAHYVFDQ